MLVTVGAHGYGTYLIFGSFAFSMFVFVWFFIPETKGLSLEAMDALFGVVDHGESHLESGNLDHATRDSMEKEPTATQIETVATKDGDDQEDQADRERATLNMQHNKAT